MFVHIEDPLFFPNVQEYEQEAIGIDFGTTYCVVAFCQQEEAFVLEHEGQWLIPSVMKYPELAEPIFSIKRCLGKKEKIHNLCVGTIASDIFKMIDAHVVKCGGNTLLGYIAFNRM